MTVGWVGRGIKMNIKRQEEKQENAKNMNKYEGKKERRKRIGGKKDRIKEHEKKKTRLEHKRHNVSLHHVTKTDYHHLCVCSCILCSTNIDCVTKGGGFQFLEDVSKLSEQTVYPVK